jgi:hypothetical protein
MKKIFTLCVAAMTAVTMMAANYQYSLGLVGGLGLGVQFKDMVSEHFTIIDEFGYFTCTSNAGYDGAIDNLVLAYQGKAAEGQGILLDYYVGGQVKVGWGRGNCGVLGCGAAAGIEACMKNAPIAFSFDFRPGYACTLMGVAGMGVMASHLFDYSFNLGVRYKF